MGFESRHRDDVPRREDLAEALARIHRLEIAVARDVLRRAEHAAAEDPQARSVRQWFAFLVGEAQVGASAGGRPAPGRQTLVMREERDEDAAVQVSDREPAGPASHRHDVAAGWRTSPTLGFDLQGVAIRPPESAPGVGVHRAASRLPAALMFGPRFELADEIARGEVALLALDAFAAGRLSDGSLVSSLLSPPRHSMTSHGTAPLPHHLHGTLDPFAAGGGARPSGSTAGALRAAHGVAALAEVAHRRAATIFRRELADADVDLHDPVIEAALQRTRRGEPLSQALRQDMEARLGADFRSVRIHTDAVAASAAEALHATAFTVGDDIFFADGAFDPTGESGRRLLVHELTHVVQSQEGRVPTSHGVAVSRPSDALEQEAAAAYDRSTTRAGSSAASPSQARTSTPAPPGAGMLLRDPRPKAGAARAPGRNLPWLSWDAKLVIGFIDGFRRTAGKGATPEALAKIERDFKDILSLAAIGMGVHDGIPEGAWESLTDNLKGLAHVAEWIFWNLTPAGAVKDAYEWLKDPTEKAAREKEKQQHRKDFLEGMAQLVVQLAKDPGIMADLGEELGQAAGDHVAKLYGVKFANAAPYEKGKMVGRGLGYVAVEIAALFVGPETLVAKAPAAIAKLGAAGGKAARALMRLMERIPALRRLLKAAGRLGEVAQAAGPEAKLLGHLNESVIAKVAQQGLKQDELARLATLEPKAAEKLLEELPAREVLELEQQLGKAKLEKLANGKKTGKQIQELARKGPVSGETKATQIGKRVHKERADARRKSGDWDEVNQRIKTEDGEDIQVAKRVNLKTGKAVGTTTQSAHPDAVSYSRGEILDDKPLGRPISKDRQEIIRHIQAYRQRTGKLPKKIIIDRYDPMTGKSAGIETFSPRDFLP